MPYGLFEGKGGAAEDVAYPVVAQGAQGAHLVDEFEHFGVAVACGVGDELVADGDVGIQTRVCAVDVAVIAVVGVGHQVVDAVVLPDPDALVGGELVHHEEGAGVLAAAVVEAGDDGGAGAVVTGGSQTLIAFHCFVDESLGAWVGVQVRIDGIEVEVANTRGGRQTQTQSHSAKHQIFLDIHCVDVIKGEVGVIRKWLRDQARRL